MIFNLVIINNDAWSIYFTAINNVILRLKRLSSKTNYILLFQSKYNMWFQYLCFRRSFCFKVAFSSAKIPFAYKKMIPHFACVENSCLSKIKRLQLIPDVLVNTGNYISYSYTIPLCYCWSLLLLSWRWSTTLSWNFWSYNP